jgi:hypothetical protein
MDDIHADVDALMLLKHATCAQLRALLHDLDAKVLISLPRASSEQATLGPTPAADRAALQLMGTLTLRLSFDCLTLALMTRRRTLWRPTGTVASLR